MKQYNWENVFSNTPENFHKKIEETLRNLPDLERSQVTIMKKRMSWKKAVVIAAAAVLAVGGTAFAASKIVSTVSRSSSTPTYQTLPSQAEIAGILGNNAIVLDNFENGYCFEKGYVGESSAQGENGETISNYKDLSLTYQKGDHTIAIYMQPYLTQEMGETSLLAETFQEVPIYYYSYANKCVAGDYVMTEQDKADEASGKYVFSFGVEKEDPTQVQGTIWTKGEITYNILAMDSELTKEELITMSKEVISAE